MPVEVGIWELENEGVRKVEFSALEAERKLEDALEARPEIVDRAMMVVGRQVSTSQGKQIDLLGVGPDGELKVVELKRDRTPRDVVAQVLDYASWVRHLGYDEVKSIYESENASEFETAFDEAFGEGPPEDINDDHELTVVASELDDSTERIIGYLSEEYGVPINAVFFRHYRDAGRARRSGTEIGGRSPEI